MGSGVIHAEDFNKETILLVDDDIGVLRSLRLTLSRSGYEVLPADSAEKAIEIWEQHSQQIGLLLTDIRMPGKSGLELAAILRQKRPQLPVLLISGYSAELTDNEERILPSMHFLQKPFSTKVLSETVRKATQCCSLP